MVDTQLMSGSSPEYVARPPALCSQCCTLLHSFGGSHKKADTLTRPPCSLYLSSLCSPQQTRAFNYGTCPSLQRPLASGTMVPKSTRPRRACRIKRAQFSPPVGTIYTPELPQRDPASAGPLRKLLPDSVYCFVLFGLLSF